jgi:para-nitrobenzyl esterase
VGQPAYLYAFDHAVPAADAAGLHGFHGSELPYVFGTLDRTPAAWPKSPMTPAETKLSDAMIGYWTSFAATGRPQAAGAADWQAYGEGAHFMMFQDVPRPSAHLLKGMYELQEAVVCRRRAAGDVPWNWNVGLVSPPLPPKAAGCS